MKKLITLLVCLLPFSAFAEEEKKSFFGADLDVSIGVSSDYIFRGYNQNGGHLAVSGGAEASGRVGVVEVFGGVWACLLYTSPSPRDRQKSRMPSSA